MRAPRPWQKGISWFIVLPALLAGGSGLVLLLWSLPAWFLHAPRLVSAVPDWELGLGLLAGGFVIGLSFAALAKPSGSIPVNDRHNDARGRGDDGPIR